MKNFKYQVHYNIGKVKYLVSYSDGTKQHADGSEFWDVKCFKSKEKMNLFIQSLTAPDLHRQRASEIFGVPYEDVTAEQRQAGKQNNYVRLYSVRGPLEVR